MQKLPDLNPDCFGVIRLLPKKYFSMFIAYDTFEKVTTDWKKRDWAIIFDVLFVSFFKNWYNVFFFTVI